MSIRKPLVPFIVLLYLVTPVYATIILHSTPGLEKSVTVSQGFDVGLTFTLKDADACLIILMIEYPDNLVRYQSCSVQRNGGDVSSFFKVVLDGATLLVTSEESLPPDGTYKVTAAFTAHDEAGRGTLRWRGIVTTFSTPTTPPDVWDEAGKMDLTVVSPEIHVVSLKASPETVSAGQTTSIIVTVKNNYTAALTKTLNVLLNGEEYKNISVSLDPLETRMTQLEVSSEKMGVNTVTVKGLEATFTVSPNLSKYYLVIIAVPLAVVLLYMYMSSRRPRLAS